jgi:hypothetical protein
MGGVRARLSPALVSPLRNACHPHAHSLSIHSRIPFTLYMAGASCVHRAFAHPYDAEQPYSINVHLRLSLCLCSLNCLSQDLPLTKVR